MLILLGILLDGALTVGLGILIATQAKMSPLFYVSIAALHGLMAVCGIILFAAVKTLEHDPTSAAITPDQARREPKVVPIFEKPKLDRAA